jgi:hypothetical protein
MVYCYCILLMLYAVILKIHWFAKNTLTNVLILKISIIKKPLNRQADKFDRQIFSMGFKSPSISRMTEWLQSKLSEQLHSIMKEPQTTACGHYFTMGKFRGKKT